MTSIMSDERTAVHEAHSDASALQQQSHDERGDIAGVLEGMPYGVYIIGSARDGRPNGMIADWVMQVSFAPHLIATSFENDSYSLESIRQNGALTVNMLPRNVPGMRLAARFVQPHEGQKIKRRTRDHAALTYEKLHGVDFTITDQGCPILSDGLAWIECEAQQFVDVGDHTLVIAHVVDGAVTGRGELLTSAFTGWAYAG